MRASIISLAFFAPIVVRALAVERYTNIQDCLTAAGVPQNAPGTTNFSTSILPFNLRLPFTPVAVAVPLTVPQVQAAVKCGVQSGLKVNPKSGGHSYASHGLGGEDGHFMIDMKYWYNVTVNPVTQVATVQPGARLGNIAQQVYAQGKRAFSHGTCPGVGLGGHVLDGGYGYTSHTWGLALDMLLEAQVVLADGAVVNASENENPDLFWALRGAGASYGIVTQYKFKTYPAVDQLIKWEYSYNWTQAEGRKALDVIQAYAASKDYPAEMNARFFLTANNIKFWGVFQGTRAVFDPVFNDIVAKLPGTPTATSIVETGWIDSIKKWAFMNITMPVDYTIHENFFSKSMMTKVISPAGLDKFTDYWYQVANYNTRDWYCIIDLHGGPNSAITKVDHDSTSYAHRDALWKFELYDRVPNNVTYPAGGQSFLNGWVNTVKSMYGETLGMYINYADPSISENDAHNEYWLNHCEKLSKIKDKYDSKRVFMNPQAVNS